MVEVLDNGSKVVCKITVDQAREIYQVRISLEALLLKLAWSEIDRSLMQQLQGHTLDVITHENFEDMSEVLGKFYSELYAKSNNKLLAESITVLHNKVNLIKVDLINQVKKASCDEIMKLFQAIIDNDQQKANLRLEQHLMGSYYRLFGEL
ncbi:hypothetical protein JCM19239_5484 [Vibrio variabilis]|uniref:GntR C-terminal domain-containing protein n=1 Tax=Vibrio variabilis TaxID=990271 RepID=A0ABQ0JHK1_9VIBR|nr:hypothetical protein JCM19239_5484 [Vibrio variabilis]